MSGKYWKIYKSKTAIIYCFYQKTTIRNCYENRKLKEIYVIWSPIVSHVHLILCEYYSGCYKIVSKWLINSSSHTFCKKKKENDELSFTWNNLFYIVDICDQRGISYCNENLATKPIVDFTIRLKISKSHFWHFFDILGIQKWNQQL